MQYVFNGYAMCFQKALWHTSLNYSDVTSADLNFFTTLGHSLGFRVRREMNWQYPRDLCWCRTDELVDENANSKDAKTELYLERENNNSRAKYTIKKMLHKDNAPSVPYLVAVFGWIRKQTLADVKDMIRAAYLQENQTFLLISWVGDAKDGEHWLLEGWYFSRQEESVRTLNVKMDDNKHWYVITNPSDRSKQLLAIWAAVTHPHPAEIQ